MGDDFMSWMRWEVSFLFFFCVVKSCPPVEKHWEKWECVCCRGRGGKVWGGSVCVMTAAELIIGQVLLV